MRGGGSYLPNPDAVAREARSYTSRAAPRIEAAFVGARLRATGDIGALPM